MKLFIWEDCLSGSYGDGQIIAYAETIGQALDSVAQTGNEEALEFAMDHVPKIYSTPIAFCIRGSD